MLATANASALGSDEIHLQLLALDAAAADVDDCARLLSADEHARAARFHLARHRDDFIRCRAWLRRVLGAYLQRDPASLAFINDKFGKPRLITPGTEWLSFNLSHSHRHALLAIARECPVGADIEWVDPNYDFAAAAPLVLPWPARLELKLLAAESAAVRRACFFRWWARTEAVLKASGVGFSSNARGNELDAYATRDLEIAPGYAAAIALPRERDCKHIVLHAHAGRV